MKAPLSNGHRRSHSRKRSRGGLVFVGFFGSGILWFGLQIDLPWFKFKKD